MNIDEDGVHQGSGGFDTAMEKEVIDEANKTGETACEIKGKTTVQKSCAEPSDAAAKTKNKVAPSLQNLKEAFSDQDEKEPAQN